MNTRGGKEPNNASIPRFVHPNSQPPSVSTPIPASVVLSFLLFGLAAFAFYRGSQGSDSAILLTIVGGLCGVLGGAVVWRCRGELLEFFRSQKTHYPTNPFDNWNA